MYWFVCQRALLDDTVQQETRRCQIPTKTEDAAFGTGSRGAVPSHEEVMAQRAVQGSQVGLH